MDVLRVLQDITLVVFLGLGYLGLRLYRRKGALASGWVAIMFGVLAAVLVAGRLARTLPPPWPVDAISLVTGPALVTFPYLLFRFVEALDARGGWVRRSITAVAAAAVVTTAVAIPAGPQDDEARPGWYLAFLGLLLAYWAGVSLYVSVRMWRNGRGQPAPARTRMRWLAAASLLLTAALLLAGFAAGTPGRELGVAIATQVLAIASAAAFALAFSPPQILRMSWRRGEEHALRDAESVLMVAASRQEVAEAVLPAIARMLGGAAAGLYDGDGNPIQLYGDPGLPSGATDENAGPERTWFADRRLVVPLRSGTLVVTASPFAPFFGEDEVELLRSLGVSVDLAMARLESLEQERRARAALQQTNEELQALVYGISHDLRNPLVTILGYLDLLRTEYPDALGEEGTRFLGRIDASASYMDALIQDLLELSRVGRMQAEAQDVDLARLVREIAESLRGEHPQASVEVGSLPTVRMSSVRARQLFTNLVHNAIVHGGRPDVHVTVDSRPGEDGGCAVVVADDGVGIPPGYRDRVFGIFERLSSDDGAEQRGTGIGLAICRKIVEQLGGTIEVVDAPRGAAIEIRFPMPAVQPAAVMEVQT